MPHAGAGPVVGLAVSVALHMLMFVWAAGHLSTRKTERLTDEPIVIHLKLPPPPEAVTPEPVAAVHPPAPAPSALPAPTLSAPEVVLATVPETPRQPASMAAPSAPTTEEWAFAGRYTLKNSKAYRYTWGQQVRSMMGTAVEGLDQGIGRFLVGIAPLGAVSPRKRTMPWWGPPTGVPITPRGCLPQG